MKLHYQRTGCGHPLVILHGLFGTLENWGSHIKNLSQQFEVIAVDLRNHGRSSHSDAMSYPLMADDLLQLFDDLKINKTHLLGHSMGGKVAMQFALSHADRVEKLMVADIAPVTYPPHHEQVFAGLFSVDLSSLTSRSDADRQLSVHLEDAAIRAFLLKNLYRNDAGQFAWRMNLNALKSEYEHIAAPPCGTPFVGKTRFIKGGLSHYIQAEHTDAVRALFPNADVKIIAGAGHWLHAEKPALFLRQVELFLA